MLGNKVDLGNAIAIQENDVFARGRSHPPIAYARSGKANVRVPDMFCAQPLSYRCSKNGGLMFHARAIICDEDFKISISLPH